MSTAKRGALTRPLSLLLYHLQPYVNESLGATVAVTLWRRKSFPLASAFASGSKDSTRETRDIIFQGVGEHAGLEVMATGEQLRLHPAVVALLSATPLGHPLAGAALAAAVVVLFLPHCFARSKA